MGKWVRFCFDVLLLFIVVTLVGVMILYFEPRRDSGWALVKILSMLSFSSIPAVFIFRRYFTCSLAAGLIYALLMSSLAYFSFFLIFVIAVLFGWLLL